MNESRLAASRGYDVCVGYRQRSDAAQQVVADCLAYGGRALAVAVDVGVESDVERLFSTVDTELGPLAALVNNAGMLELQMRVDQMDAGRIERVLRANVVGSFLCSREAVRRMSTRHGGAATWR